MYTLEECIDEVCNRYNLNSVKNSLYKLMETYRHKEALAKKHPEVIPIINSIRILNQSWKYSFLKSISRKECKQCGCIKSEDDFNVGRGNCRICQKSNWKDYYETNRDKIIAKVIKRQRDLDRELSIYEINFILARDKYKCLFCGYENEQHIIDYGQRLHIDHIMPFSKGGLTTVENSQLLCIKCNSKKKDNLPA